LNILHWDCPAMAVVCSLLLWSAQKTNLNPQSEPEGVEGCPEGSLSSSIMAAHIVHKQQVMFLVK
jgi:hypothetical protein